MRSLVVGLLVTSFMSQAAPISAQIKIRKNVDAMTATELADYDHALTILRGRPDTDPTSYRTFEKLHNGGSLPNGKSGGCIHEEEGFLPWHRILLAQFEKALQESDPPRTAKVTIPYWDFTKPPSGRRFPKAFEDSTTKLWHDKRFNLLPNSPQSDIDKAAAIEKSRQERTEPGLLETNLHSLPTFAEFGGSGIDGELERTLHNWMHGGYSGGDMGRDTTAARDAIFWSFHANIDLLWYHWQLRHDGVKDVASAQVPVDLDHIYDHFSPPASVRSSLNPQSMSYRYDVTPEQTLTLTALKPLPAPNATTFSWPRAAAAAPAPAPERRRQVAGIRIEKLKVPYTGSWQVDAYLHPRRVAPAFGDEAFRRRYRAGYFVKWEGSHRHQQTGEMNVTVVVSSRLVEESATSNEEWVVSVDFAALLPNDVTPSAAPGGAGPTFSGLSLFVR